MHVFNPRTRATLGRQPDWRTQAVSARSDEPDDEQPGSEPVERINVPILSPQVQESLRRMSAGFVLSPEVQESLRRTSENIRRLGFEGLVAGLAETTAIEIVEAAPDERTGPSLEMLLSVAAFIVLLQLLIIGWRIGAEIGPDARQQFVEFLALVTFASGCVEAARRALNR